ncbi:uncharacterized protein EV422DRAFT_513294 [Fimicolochytrium jonesii]|uniref:uncharacterized protein n=1 Tax=Fimicolochytrium jonesii TaxID=1396493 RepID=UPI0022FDCF5D|nr:uncharacterized protein EV422DRAFT_513294 [Fimicolochytrium jonesii]KAI8827291.1 hypothetical protein EV422DRAFT_513294 [Fimicolochytrium jonesii]
MLRSLCKNSCRRALTASGKRPLAMSQMARDPGSPLLIRLQHTVPESGVLNADEDRDGPVDATSAEPVAPAVPAENKESGITGALQSPSKQHLPGKTESTPPQSSSQSEVQTTKLSEKPSAKKASPSQTRSNMRMKKENWLRKVIAGNEDPEETRNGSLDSLSRGGPALTIGDFRSAVRLEHTADAIRIFWSMANAGALTGLGWRDYGNLIKLIRDTNYRPMDQKPGERGEKAARTVTAMEGILEVMQQNGVLFTPGIYATMASTYARAGRVDKVREVLDKAEARGWVVQYAQAILLNARAKGEPKIALEELEKSLEGIREPDESLTGVYNSLLQQFSTEKDSARFQRCLKLGQKYRIVPNATTYDVLVRHFAVYSPNMVEALALNEQRLRHGLPRSSRAYQSIIHGYHIAKNPAKVIEYYREMETYDLHRHVNVYNKAIAAMGQLRDARGGMAIYLSLLRAKSTKPIRPTYAALSTVLELWPTSFREHVTAAGGVTSKLLYRGVIKGLADAKADAQTARICNEYRDLCKKHPQTFSLSTDLIKIELNSLCRLKKQVEAEALWDEHFKGRRNMEDVFAYRALFVLYARTSNAAMARKTFEEYKSRGHVPDLFVYNGLVRSVWNQAADAPMNDECVAYLREAAKLGLIDEVNTVSETGAVWKGTAVVGRGDVERGFRILKSDEKVDVLSLPKWTELNLEDSLAGPAASWKTAQGFLVTENAPDPQKDDIL